MDAISNRRRRLSIALSKGGPLARGKGYLSPMRAASFSIRSISVANAVVNLDDRRLVRDTGNSLEPSPASIRALHSGLVLYRRCMQNSWFSVVDRVATPPPSLQPTLAWK